MIKIAIVEDNKAEREQLVAHVKQFEKERVAGDVHFTVDCFENGMKFITDYKPEYDVVFMDINMPLLDGLSTANQLRKYDEEIAIIFVTNFGQYAIRGYEVDAIDFLLKPVPYFVFSERLKKAISSRKRGKKNILLKTEGEFVRVPLRSIQYIEKFGHDIFYHTELGEYRDRANLKDIENRFLPFDFVKCNRGCLVNLSAITKVESDNVYIGDVCIGVSGAMKKAFKLRLIEYARGVN